MNKNLEYPINILLNIFPYCETFYNTEKFDDLLEKIKNEFERFTERDINVIKLYYKDKLTYSAIGKEYGVSGTRIRQIIVKTIRKFRHPSISKNILKEMVNNDEEKH